MSVRNQTNKSGPLKITWICNVPYGFHNFFNLIFFRRILGQRCKQNSIHYTTLVPCYSYIIMYSPTLYKIICTALLNLSFGLCVSYRCIIFSTNTCCIFTLLLFFLTFFFVCGFVLSMMNKQNKKNEAVIEKRIEPTFIVGYRHVKYKISDHDRSSGIVYEYCTVCSTPHIYITHKLARVYTYTPVNTNTDTIKFITANSNRQAGR